MRILNWVWYVVCLIMVLIAFPGVLIIDGFLGPLDSYPYLLCAGLGIVFIIVAWVVRQRWISGWNNSRLLLVLLFGTILLPFLFIDIGISANALLDRSPPVRHEAQVLRYDLRGKGPGVCIVQSWRGNIEETLSDPNFVQQRIPPSGCRPGSRLQVVTHAGAFGWEWVKKVEY
jgi:hypothetical protein